jgi:hypothetical protein
MDNKFSNIKERILYLTDYYKISKELFFENIGMTYGSFKGSAKERPLNSDAIVKILSIYTEINSDWLLTGNGSMLKKDYQDFIVVPDKSEELFKSFSNIQSKEVQLLATVDKLSQSNEMLTKENSLQAKIIEGLEFKISILEKELSKSKFTQKETFLYNNVAEPAPELIKK